MTEFTIIVLVLWCLTMAYRLRRVQRQANATSEIVETMAVIIGHIDRALTKEGKRP